MTAEPRLPGIPQGSHPQARIEAASSLRRLGHALVGHDPDAELLARVAGLADELADAVESSPRRSRRGELLAEGRFLKAMETGRLSTPFPEGGPLELFADSVVSGAANPLGIGIQARREGDEAVAEVTLGPAFEGAPGRAHGGIVAAILDETMGFLLPVLGVVAFTGSLTIDYLAPTPLHEPLEFRAGLRTRGGRRLYIDAHGRAGETLFVSASGTFIQIDLGAFAGTPVEDPR